MLFRSRKSSKAATAIDSQVQTALDAQPGCRIEAPAVDATPDFANAAPIEPTQGAAVAKTIGNPGVRNVARGLNGAAATSAVSVPPIPAPTAALDPAEAKQRADYSHRLMHAFGSIMAVYLRSKSHRELPLAHIERVVSPAVSTGQFILAESSDKQTGLVTPVAVLIWASVSPEVEARIVGEQKALTLTLADWKSGETIWVLEAVGEQQIVGSLLQRVMMTSWKERAVKTRIIGADGRPQTKVLQARRAVQ